MASRVRTGAYCGRQYHRPALIHDLPEIQQIVRDAYIKYVERIGKPPAPMLDDYGKHILAHEAWMIQDGSDIEGVLILVL